MNDDCNKRMQLIAEHAWILATEQVNLAELHMQQHPEQYPEFTAIQKELNALADKLEHITNDPLLIDNYHTAHLIYAASLASETYLRGVLDAVQIYHACLHNT